MNKKKERKVLSDKESFLKKTASPNYRKAIKRLVETVKILRNLDKIPNAQNRPTNPEKQKLYDKNNQFNVTKSCLHFFLDINEAEETRRLVRPSATEDSKDIVKDSLKY